MDKLTEEKNAGRRLWIGRINLTVNQQTNNTL